MTEQEITFKIEWPEDKSYQYYVLQLTTECWTSGGFWTVVPDGAEGAPCHIIIERPREVCNRWWARGPYRAIIEVEEDDAEFWCTLDAGHDGPCMMELGRAE